MANQDGESPPPPVEPALHEARAENPDNRADDRVDKPVDDHTGDHTGDHTENHTENHSGNHSGNQSPHKLRDSKGWDGKLRVDRGALIQNPEAFSDPEYSDDENVLPGEEIGADEGISPHPLWYLFLQSYFRLPPLLRQTF